MAAPGDESARSLRDFAERTLFSGIGVVVLTRDRLDELAAELERRSSMTRDEAAKLLEELIDRWRGEPARFGERASLNLSGVFRDLGLVTRREFEELDLRLAQVEHRLRLVERGPAQARATTAPAPEEPVTAPLVTGARGAAETVPPAASAEAESAPGVADPQPPSGRRP
ncbi:MAG: hypothetical protein E6G67_06435 [Actinobacteria bacterium]|nr:MAG: hypothetical protein E6G67_06435 [Actinomycetota bacterium]